MSALLSALLAALPGVLLRLVAPLVTEELLYQVMRRVVVRGLRKAATLTQTTLDDEIIEDVIARLEAAK